MNQNDNPNSKDQNDSEEEEYCYLCFKIKKKKPISRGLIATSSDKMSMQNISYDYQIAEQRKGLLQNSQFKAVESQVKISDFKPNKLFLLHNKHSKEEIITKITEKFFNSNELSGSLLGLDSPKSPHLEQLQQAEYTPEYVARHIAKRLKEFQIVVDLGCGAGGNIVQLGKECDYVVGIEIDNNLIELAKKNCQTYGICADLINADIFTLNSLKPDVIFVNPNFKNDVCKDLLEECNPNINKVLLNHQKLTKNFVFQLPPQFDLSQIPLLININSQFAYFRRNYPAFFYIELEKIFINRQLEFIIIYCGEVADIKQTEILKFLAKQFRKVQLDQKQISKQRIFWLFDLIVQNIGLEFFIYRAVEAIKQKVQVENFCKFLKQQFQLNIDLYQAYINNDMEDMYSVSRVENDHQDFENMSPNNFSYKQIEFVNTYSYNKENPFDVFDNEEDVGSHNSFIMNVKH